MVELAVSLGIPGIVVLVCLSAFFSASEIAIFSLEDRPGGSEGEGGALDRLREDPHRLLVTILIGNNFVNVAIATLTTTLLVRDLPPNQAAVVSTVVVGTVVLVFGEIVPKSYGVGHAESFARRVARPVELVGLLLYPVVAVFDAITGVITRLVGGGGDIERPYVTREELSAIVDTAEQEGVLEGEEGTLIQRVFRFSEVTVGSVMVPRADVVGVEATATAGEALATCLEARVTRAPVYEGTLDTVLGHADVRDLAAADPDDSLDGHLHPVVYVFESRPVDELLAELQEERVEMALVFDEFGAVEGLVTAEDIVEELVGEIFDVKERRTVVPLEGGAVSARGKASVEAVNEAFPGTLPMTRGETVAGLLSEALGRPAAVGEVVEFPEATVTVQAVEGNRVRRVLVEPREPTEPTEPTESVGGPFGADSGEREPE
jgi:CBS domain containing-hemolysin-like protein